ncbi:hypothetical protein MERGE_000069 [Pneumocystis wakefieldiae]|uniref:HORMA domain-containing protein n=1 Tax=Pneumocystis wakefieldiae TaxID=38082 RepID=A0A899FVI6_9ASCO|nr:hypothetical protein MERGE_000069 [Pneumocystis wakefieldiae]
MSAQMQLQRPSVRTHTTGSTSQQLIQTMIEASFGCILYVRGLFPDDNFSEERYNQKSNKSSILANSGTRIMKIKRGFSEEADLLLDYLNQGVYDALSKKYLRSILFAIYFDPNDSTNIFESYTFNFVYSGRDKKPMMNVVNSKGEKQSFGVEEEYAKRCIQLLLRNLITLTQNLSPLPENKNRYITMKLFYTDATPQDYQPPMFRDCTMEKPFTFAVDPENPSFYKQTAGSIDTGFHAITLNITSIADAVSECKSFEEYQDKQIKTLSAEEDVFEKEDLKDSLKENIIILDSPKKHQSCPELLPSLSQNNIPKQSLKYMDERYEKEDAAIKEMLTTHTQDSEFEATQPLESNFSQLTQNVSYVQSKPSFENDAKVKVEKARKKNSEKIEIKEIASVGKNLSKLTLNSRKAFELSEEKKRLSYIRNTAKGSAKDIDVIRCECGDIQCYVCQSWVHAWCYGFISGNDERLPDDHSCYSCLLRKFEPILYESMKDLALFRRALMIIWEEGLPGNNSEFSNRLGCSRQNACQILKRLLQEGFIANVPQNRASRTNNAKKNGRSNMNDEMVVVKNDENKQRLFSEYFQPLLKISHHYEKQENLNTLFQEDKSTNSIPMNALSITNSFGVNSLKDSCFITNSTPLSELQNANIPKQLSIKEMNDINHNNAELDTTDDEDLSAQNIVKKPYLTESTNLINSNADFVLQKHNTVNHFKTYATSNINHIPKKNTKRTCIQFSGEDFDAEAKKRKSRFYCYI